MEGRARGFGKVQLQIRYQGQHLDKPQSRAYVQVIEATRCTLQVVVPRLVCNKVENAPSQETVYNRLRPNCSAG